MYDPFYGTEIGTTPLIDAVIQRDENKIRALIDAGADVNIRSTGFYGETALFHAVQQSNNESVVRALIDAGADVNIRSPGFYGQTALFHAIQQSNNESVVRALIDGGAQVNKTDESGETALFYAVQQSNNESVVRTLIDAGADVNITDDNEGHTALFHAVQTINNESVVRALIKAGADVNMTDMDGQTALFYAVQQSNNESVVRALIDAGVNINKTNCFPDCWCAEDGVVHSLSGTYDSFYNSGKTALFYAVQQSSNERVVGALIDAGADINKTEEIGQTVLFYAVQQSNNENVVRALIDAGGAFVNVRDVFGRTPLFYAFDYPKSARILVEKGRKHPFFLKDIFNCSILNCFVDRHLFHDDSEDSLSQNIPPGFFDLLDECAVQKVTFSEAILNIAFCKFPGLFIERSVLLTQFTSFCRITHITRALELASQFIDNEEEINMLIALINGKCKNGEGVSEALQLLVKLGADPNSVDLGGNTALHYATGLASMGVPQDIVMEICLQLEKLGVSFNWRNHRPTPGP